MSKQLRIAVVASYRRWVPDGRGLRERSRQYTFWPMDTSRFGRLESGDATSARELLADRYEVLAPIGAGGAANVFRARDPKHERDVAIKLLRSELTATIGVD